jgi:hypothetical protein
MPRAKETTSNCNISICNIKRQGTMISKVERPMVNLVEGMLWPRILLRETAKKDLLQRPNHHKSVPVKRRRYQQMKVKDRIKEPTTTLPIIEYSSSSSYGCACDVPSLVLDSENWKRATLHGRPGIMAGKKWSRIVPVQQVKKQAPCLITRIRTQPSSMVN